MNGRGGSRLHQRGRDGTLRELELLVLERHDCIISYTMLHGHFACVFLFELSRVLGLDEEIVLAEVFLHGQVFRNAL